MEFYLRGKLSRQAVLFLEENELAEDTKEKLIEKCLFIRGKIEIVWRGGEHFVMVYCERKNDILEYTKKKFELILCQRIY